MQDTFSAFDLIVIGNSGFDVNIFPKENSEKSIIKQIGGAVNYTAVPASFVSNKIGVFTTVGEDFPTNYFQNYGISTIGLETVSGNSTKWTNTYFSKDGQERLCEVNRNEKYFPTIENFPEEYLNTKFIHIATDLPENQISEIKYLRSKTNAKISIDTIENYYYDFPEKVLEAFNLADIAFIDKKFDLLINKAITDVKIIKKGKDGCTYLARDIKIDVPAPEVESVVDKTGAGDCVCGVFLSLLAQTNNIKFSLEKANEIASASITTFGVDSIPYNFKNILNQIQHL